MWLNTFRASSSTLTTGVNLSWPSCSRHVGFVEFRRLDREFHTTITAACGNPLLIELYGKVLDQLFRSMEFFTLLSAESNQPEVVQIIADSCVAHRRIADAFSTGDALAVRVAIESHLDSVEQSMVDDLH
jgi:GntR family transcriptional regulator, transcriptional repressor for pyruvate dehydrogenase complex